MGGKLGIYLSPKASIEVAKSRDRRGSKNLFRDGKLAIIVSPRASLSLKAYIGGGEISEFLSPKAYIDGGGIFPSPKISSERESSVFFYKSQNPAR